MMLHYSIALIIAGSLCLASPISLTKRATASSGNFNVISIGVNGFPATFDPSGIPAINKTINMMYIGTKISHGGYDIVNVQEDFDYHATLYQYDNHRFRTATSGGVPVGSGLNTLSNYSWIDFSRIDWYFCGGACVAKQGFTFMRMRIEEGVYIDMINLDTNAWTDPADQMARRWNIEQVSDFINVNSVGNAVIVCGNTHLRYTSSRDNIRVLTAQNGLTDAWVQAIGGKAPAAGADPMICPEGVPLDINCEDEHNVLYRGSHFIDLTSLGFYYDTPIFLSQEGSVLTSQNPIRVEFAWSFKSELRQSDLYGGAHGTWFNDLPLVPSAPKLASIVLRGANRLDGFTLTLTSGRTFTHGGSGGTAYILDLASDEYIKTVKLCWNKHINGHTRIFYAKATTNKSKMIQVGQWSPHCATSVAPSGYGVVGTYGQDGQEIDQLGFIYAPQ
ncbi:putative protein Mb0912 [Mycobacterium bovis AF2122/97] [Rhizoctonia solani]|uniref:Jacalin-type lectin domain-containing protein n=1 Tax=Rhizoctonia solani TaxID=456999 RepID=A0A0K6FMM1_9AGAM|nr:putative protein Mb0912 [Mycobacterium bovis AF2122/97] [Rhizoctonia solani]